MTTPGIRHLFVSTNTPGGDTSKVRLDWNDNHVIDSGAAIPSPVITTPELDGVITTNGHSYRVFNPYVAKAHTYKGQIHCHTTNSDGTNSPATIADAYHTAGCDFLAITDHDYLTPDTSHAGLLYVPGVEESPSHFNALSLFCTKVQGSATADNQPSQTVLDGCDIDNAVAGIAHPMWGNCVRKEDALSLLDYGFIEIRNAKVETDPADTSFETIWDDVLSANKVVWGTVSDDCHNIATAAEFDKYYIKCFADSCTLANIKESIQRGNFYCTTKSGITPTISLSGLVITVGASANSDITFIGKRGLVYQTNANTVSASYTITGRERYIRVMIKTTGAAEYVWLQPIFIKPLDSMGDIGDTQLGMDTFMTKLWSQKHFQQIPINAGWGTTFVGTGGILQEPCRQYISTGATLPSSALAYFFSI